MTKSLTALAVAGALSAALLGLAPLASASGPYNTCKDAIADGRYNIPIGDPDYGDWLDRDHDGIACES